MSELLRSQAARLVYLYDLTGNPAFLKQAANILDRRITERP